MLPRRAGGHIAGRRLLKTPRTVQGLLPFVPVGFGGATLKATPPLTITSDAAHEGLAVLAEAIAEAMVPPRQA